MTAALTLALAALTMTAPAPTPTGPDAVIARWVRGTSQERPRINVWLNRDEVYSRGDRARVYFKSDVDAYVTIVRIDTDGRVRVLFPMDPWEDNWARGGKTFEVLGRDRIDGESCRVLRLRPLDGPYTMLLAWVSEERPVMLRTDYFDEQGLWKRYRARPENIAQNFDWWVPMQDEMIDLRSGRHTVRHVRNILIGTDVPDDAFTLTQLARGRLPSF